METPTPKRRSKKETGRAFPPGRIRITEALTSLLTKKDFGSITTAEIAETAGVTEALIYKYFKDKRDLLYQVLREYLEHYEPRIKMDLRGIKGSLNKLRKLMWSHLNVYAKDRVFAKILLLQVRSFSDFYTSEPYLLVQRFSGIVLDIIAEGIENGEIRNDIDPRIIRQVVMGAIEQVCLTNVVFNRPIQPEEMGETLCQVVFKGITKNAEGR